MCLGFSIGGKLRIKNKARFKINYSILEKLISHMRKNNLVFFEYQIYLYEKENLIIPSIGYNYLFEFKGRDNFPFRIFTKKDNLDFFEEILSYPSPYFYGQFFDIYLVENKNKFFFKIFFQNSKIKLNYFYFDYFNGENFPGF